MMPLPESSGLTYSKPVEIKPGDILTRRIRDMLLLEAMMNVQRVKDLVMDGEEE